MMLGMPQACTSSGFPTILKLAHHLQHQKIITSCLRHVGWIENNEKTELPIFAREFGGSNLSPKFLVFPKMREG